jgi:hypothetical protein
VIGHGCYLLNFVASGLFIDQIEGCIFSLDSLCVGYLDDLYLPMEEAYPVRTKFSSSSEMDVEKMRRRSVGERRGQRNKEKANFLREGQGTGNM